MPILGYSLKKMSAEKKRPFGPAQRIDISSTPEVTSVEETTLELFGKQPTLLINFQFTTAYTPDIGTIKLEGELIYSTPNSKKVLKEWSKDKKLPLDMDAEVRNFLFRKCLKFELGVSDELQLPSPVAFPVIVPKDKKEKADEERENKTKYIG